MNEEAYQDWFSDNQEDCLDEYSKECNIPKEDIENVYPKEFDIFCREWYQDIQDEILTRAELIRSKNK